MGSDIMIYLNFRRIMNFIVLGVVISVFFLLILLIPYFIFLEEFIIGNVDNNLIMGFIIIGLFLLGTLISTFASYYLLSKEASRTLILRIAIISIITSLLTLFIISFITLWFFDATIFSAIEYYELILIFPQQLIYFSIFILGEVYYLFIIMIFFYFIYFILFL